MNKSERRERLQVLKCLRRPLAPAEDESPAMDISCYWADRSALGAVIFSKICHGPAVGWCLEHFSELLSRLAGMPDGDPRLVTAVWAVAPEDELTELRKNEADKLARDLGVD